MSACFTVAFHGTGNRFQVILRMFNRNAYASAMGGTATVALNSSFRLRRCLCVRIALASRTDVKQAAVIFAHTGLPVNTGRNRFVVVQVSGGYAGGLRRRPGCEVRG